MRHTVVVHLKDASILHGYYEGGATTDPVTGAPFELPDQITIALENGNAPVTFRLSDAKAVFFVRSFAGSPKQKDVRFFDSLSIHPLLWVRLTFADGEVMEGRVANALDLLTGAAFRLFPVDELTNNQCLFVPKSSLTSFQVIGLLDEPAKQHDILG
jgi:hypothetical protein